MFPATFLNSHKMIVNTNLQPLLKKAMNCDLVTQVLSRGWAWARNRELIVDNVKLLHVYPRSREHHVLKYNVYLYGDHGDEEQILLGELVHGDARKNYAEHIQSLYRHRMGQLKKQEWEDEVDMLQELGMVVCLAGLSSA